MALLRFLPGAFEGEGAAASQHLVIDLEAVGAGHGEAELLGLTADLVVIDREAGLQNDRVEAVEGGAAKAVFLGEGGQRSGRREGRDAEDEIVLGIDFGFEVEGASGRIDGGGGKVEVAAAGDLIGEEITGGDSPVAQHASTNALVKDLVGVALDGESRVVEEGEVLDLCRIGEVDEDRDPVTGAKGEDGIEEAVEIESRKLGIGGRHDD